MSRAKIKINGVDGSNDDLPINVLVQLDNDGNGGEATYAWLIIDQPDGPADALSSLTIQNPTLTLRKEGTYLLQLTVNGSLVDSRVAAVRQLKSGDRIPAGDETTEDDPTKGWKPTVNAMFQRADLTQSDSNRIVAQSFGGATANQICRVTGFQTLKPGLPGQETVPLLSAAGGGGSGPLAIIEAAVRGGSPASTLVFARAFGLVPGTFAGDPAVGDKVYVDAATSLPTLTVAPQLAGYVVSHDGVAHTYRWVIDGHINAVVVSASDTDAVVFDDSVLAAQSNVRENRAANRSPIDNTKSQITNLGSKDGTINPAAAGTTGTASTIGGGNDNQASGDYSTVAGGGGNTASGASSAVLGGRGNIASGAKASVPAGTNNVASGDNALAGGNGSTASDADAIAFGNVATASNQAAVALGQLVVASGIMSAAIGGNSTASGTRSATMGGNGHTASGQNSACIGGQVNTATGNSAAALGGGSSNATGNGAIVLGAGCTASGDDSIAGGNGSVAGPGAGAIALGMNGNQATGQGAVAIGFGNTASGSVFGSGAAAIGNANVASANAAVALGDTNGASAVAAVAIGSGNVALAAAAVAIGNLNTASAAAAAAIGNSNTASGAAAVALGNGTTASAAGSTGIGESAASIREGQVAIASGANSNAGDAQTSVLVLRGSTPGVGANEAVELLFGATGVQTLQLEDGKTYAVKATVAAGGVQAGPVRKSRSFEISFNVRRDAGLSVITGAGVGQAYGDAATNGWTFVAAIGAGPDRVTLTFTTGAVVSACQVVTKVELTEVTY